jgi:glyoxylase-like metal-dependent hydrolase (beta-lactamase superfamily II)
MSNEKQARLLATVGAVQVYIVPEIVIPTSVRWLLPDAPRDQVEAAKSWLRPHFMDENGYLLQSVHTYVLKAGSQTLLIDTGVGNGKDRGGAIPAFNRLEEPYLERLASTGVRPEDVDFVLCTHMHTDHVGWDAKREGEAWVPTFPRARHLFARPEFEAFSATLADQPSNQQLWQDSIEPAVKAGLVDIVEADHRVTTEIRLEPSHGHTPGHVSIRVDSEGRSAVFIGDAMHSPLQVRFPDLRSSLGGPEAACRCSGRTSATRVAASSGAPASHTGSTQSVKPPRSESLPAPPAKPRHVPERAAWATNARMSGSWLKS